MQLKKLQISNYRSVEDSTEFTLEQLTCLVGKNESGKTNILTALYKLNPYELDAPKFNKEDDYPRRFLNDYEERHPSTDATVVNSTWELAPDDIAAVEQEYPEIKFKSAKATISNGFENKRRWALDLDEAKFIKAVIDKAGLTLEDQEGLSSLKTYSKFNEALTAIKEPSERQRALMEDLSSRFMGGPHSIALKILDERMPKFVLFSQYDSLMGRVSVDEIKRKIANPATLTRPDRIFLSFLALAKVTLEELDQIDRFESLKARIEAVSIKITEKLFQYWSQNRFLEVQFSLDPGLTGDDAPFNQGRVMRTRIYNRHHKMSVPFDMRSAGFVWFYSFLVYFSQVQRNYNGNVIVLLDEPGLTLHARAQEDLLRYMNQELTPKHQVIYTTHSPFMVDPENLLAVRTVEDLVLQRQRDGHTEIEVLGTKVGEKYALSTDKDTLFPLQGILGYGVTQTLFIGPYSVLVEGMSDVLFLRVFSDALRAKGRRGLDPKWTLCPVGSITKIQSFVSLFHGNGIRFASVVDYAKGDKKKVEDLRAHVEALRAGSVHAITDYTGSAEGDIEDLLGPKAYLALVAQAYDLGDTDRKRLEEGDNPRIVKKVEENFRALDPNRYPNFDHFHPAHYLAEHAELIEELPDMKAALNRFEKLFTAIG